MPTGGAALRERPARKHEITKHRSWVRGSRFRACFYVYMESAHGTGRIAFGDDLDADVERHRGEPLGAGCGQHRPHRQHAGADHDLDAGRHAAVGLPLRRPAGGLHHAREQRHAHHLAVRSRATSASRTTRRPPARPSTSSGTSTRTARRHRSEPRETRSTSSPRRGLATTRELRSRAGRRPTCTRTPSGRARRSSRSRPQISPTGTRTRSSARSRPARRDRSPAGSTTTRRST